MTGYRRVGIVGGIAPESTIEYYRLILTSYRARSSRAGNPSIIINSIDLTKTLALAANDLDALTDYMVAEVDTLVRAGADFAVIASNTPHIVFDEIQRRVPIPMISIVEAAAEAAAARGLRRLGLFGTRFTMQGPSYPRVFARAGIELVTPGEEEQSYIHDKYVGELVNAVFLPDTREGLLRIVRRMVARDAIDGLILGGTELPLILRDDGDVPVPLLDTTGIHVEKIVAALLS
jgi:aspartate racemase